MVKVTVESTNEEGTQEDSDIFMSENYFDIENVGSFDPDIPLAIFCERVEKDAKGKEETPTPPSNQTASKLFENSLEENDTTIKGDTTKKKRKKKKKKKKVQQYWIKPTSQKRLIFRWENWRWGNLPKRIDPLVTPPEILASCGLSIQQTWEEKFVELQSIPMRALMCPPLVYPIYLFLMVALSYILGLLGVPIFMFLPLGYVGDVWTMYFKRWIDDFNKKLPRGVSVKSQTLVNGDVGELSFLSFALDAAETEKLKHEPILAGGSGLASQAKERLRVMPCDWHRAV